LTVGFLTFFLNCSIFYLDFFFWPIVGKKNKAKTKASNLRVCLSESFQHGDMRLVLGVDKSNYHLHKLRVGLNIVGRRKRRGFTTICAGSTTASASVSIL
jgi:hypothetical protein